ncbi:UDP-glycosyltransferase 13 [Rosa sericea]
MSSESGNVLLRRAQAHVVLLPSAGMGHLTPFLRLAALLSQNHRCQLTLITTHPTVSLAESSLISRFLSAFPRVTQLHFHLLPLDSTTVNSTDPFFLRFEAIRRSAHLLSPLLSSLSPPPSALVYDVSLISPVLTVIEALPFHLPAYIFFTSSARMLSLFAYYHIVATELNLGFGDDVVEIPSINPAVPISSVPPLLLNRSSLFANIFMQDGPKLPRFNGILINTFDGIETEAVELLNGGKVIEALPPLFAVGPLVPCEFEKVDDDQLGNAQLLKWLDDQAEGSVVYVSFGSRTALSRDQIKELGDGLVRCGFRFLWVVKEKLVDREEEEGSLEIMEKMKGKGLVVKHWVDQGDILGHKAVGGFLSHCGWNSVVEAAWYGVRILAWPQHGDQKLNAEVVERSGFGIWAKTWAWAGDDPVLVVKGEDIAVEIKELMQSEELRVKALKIGEEAKRVAGCREKIFKGLIEEWSKNKMGT